MKRYAVIGHPVQHSLSPRIHAAFARDTEIVMDYRAIDAPDFDAALATFTAAGGDGANVTLPHKQRAALACASLSERAQRAGAVNTLVRRDGGWHGDNTDGPGLVRDLTGRHRLDLRERRVLLLGAGGEVIQRHRQAVIVRRMHAHVIGAQHEHAVGADAVVVEHLDGVLDVAGPVHLDVHDAGGRHRRRVAAAVGARAPGSRHRLLPAAS